MGSISAAFGEKGFFCAIDASGKQEVFCWEKNNSSLSDSAYFSSLPPLAALTGGEGFMCGLVANMSQPYCWNSVSSGTDLVPQMYMYTAYSHIAAGKDHVCAVRGSYYSNMDSGTVDCWGISRHSRNDSVFVYKSEFLNPNVNNLVLRKIVSGEGFSCGGVREGGIICWGPNSTMLGVTTISESFASLASSRDSVCGISDVSGKIKCWGNPYSYSSNSTPNQNRFMALTAGAEHFCGIREDDHGIECWGNYDLSLVPKGSGFLAIASSDFITCGVRENDLILDCWGAKGSSPDYSPPLQLCSPGLCTSDSCVEGKFAFNASILNVPDLTSLCVRKDLKICSPCGSNCSEGFFPSSVCTENADRVCTQCSLCQNSSCSDICRLHSSPGAQQDKHSSMREFVVIIGSSLSGFTLVLLAWCLLPSMITPKQEDQRKTKCTCIGKKEVEADNDTDTLPPLSRAPSVGVAQVFRLSELKDATNGFKEFNELGRGNYGFVYKAILSDGQHVAVKRANAATIIHTTGRDFEAELETLCKLRHGNIVNLLGYCPEMGERLLVYEFMPHGTLYDHLHGELSPLNWNLRFKIAMQAARGLDYLHKEAMPPIVHRDVKASNILLDSEWGARIADFGLLSSGNKELNGDLESDVYSFGIVLLEILSGRKAFDKDYDPLNIVDWAVPLIRQGKAAVIIDRNVDLPRNVEPLLKLAEIAELALREDPSQRPTISEVALCLEQSVKGGLTL
ncbi:hypothetical protein GIB67_006662 [Kingdonia uniflora]|uniref:non-specific serine/threonine protein kinase n=1 Tax=Kingdonia uniflora TaxID=39325 RepID=A0A7J7LB11_9MAGN|nr:hypothetical protein GIB67_006662 [Kingdonia uniflora]